MLGTAPHFHSGLRCWEFVRAAWSAHICTSLSPQRQTYAMCRAASDFGSTHFPKAFLVVFMFIQSIFGVFVCLLDIYLHFRISNRELCVCVWVGKKRRHNFLSALTCANNAQSKRTEYHHFRILLFAENRVNRTGATYPILINKSHKCVK